MWRLTNDERVFLFRYTHICLSQFERVEIIHLYMYLTEVLGLSLTLNLYVKMSVGFKVFEDLDLNV